MSNKVLSIIAVVSVTIAIVAVGVFVTREPEYTPPATTTPAGTYTPAPAEQTLEGVYKDGFMEGCLEDGTATVSDCVCLYDGLKARYGVDGMVGFSERFLANTLTDNDYTKIIDIVSDCY